MSLSLALMLSGCAGVAGSDERGMDAMNRDGDVVDLFAVKADIKEWELLLAELAPSEHAIDVTQGPEMALLSCSEWTYRLTGATGIAIQQAFDVEEYFTIVEKRFRSDQDVETFRETSRWGGERLIVSRIDGATFSISHSPDIGQMHIASDSACYEIDPAQAPFGSI